MNRTSKPSELIKQGIKEEAARMTPIVRAVKSQILLASVIVDLCSIILNHLSPQQIELRANILEAIDQAQTLIKNLTPEGKRAKRLS